MPLHQASTLEEAKATIAECSSEGKIQASMLDPWDFSNPDRDQTLALLKQDGNRRRAAWLVAGALVAGFGLGWAGGSWYGGATSSWLNAITQPETPPRQVAQSKSGKTEGTRKTASTSVLQPSSTVRQISAVATSISAKPLARSSDGAESAEFSSRTSPPIQADETVTGSIEPRAPLAPAPDTRPTTIEGWTVLDVRGGTAVLAGPDGVRIGMRGDTVPGIGRIDSIVRWGDRWIVATDSGLITTR